eukprot:scaffold17296_cov66-Cyclotella_meneghiniana.AAC.2
MHIYSRAPCAGPCFMRGERHAAPRLASLVTRLDQNARESPLCQGTDAHSGVAEFQLERCT